MIILKEEINDSMSVLASLSKWKLLTVGILAATGLGIHKDVGTFEHGYLLLFFAPLVCAYVDFLAYERVAGINFIAKYLREYSGQDQEMIELRSYEGFIHQCREERLYAGYEGTARFVASLIASIAVPACAFIVKEYRDVILDRVWVLLLPLLGIAFTVAAYIYHLGHLRKINMSLKETGLPNPRDGG